MRRRSWMLAVCAALFAGCNGGAALPPPQAGANVAAGAIAPAPAPEHLYVVEYFEGAVRRYTLPVTARSTPDFTITVPYASYVAVDPDGNVAVEGNGQIRYFRAPLSAASVPAATLATGSGDVGWGGSPIAFARNGDLWYIGRGPTVSRFNAPLTDGSSPAQTIALPPGASVSSGIAVDDAGDVIVGAVLTEGHGCSTGYPYGVCSTVLAYPPPYTGPAVAAQQMKFALYDGFAVTGGRLFGADELTGPNARSGIHVYDLPLAGSAPVFAIPDVVADAIAFDREGRLFVGSRLTGTIAEYVPPYSATSTPSVTLTVGGRAGTESIAIGK